MRENKSDKADPDGRYGCNTHLGCEAVSQPSSGKDYHSGLMVRLVPSMKGYKKKSHSQKLRSYHVHFHRYQQHGLEEMQMDQ